MEINLQQRPLKARLLQFRKKNKRKLQLGKDEQAQDNSTSIQNFREQRQQENIESERTSDSSNSQNQYGNNGRERSGMEYTSNSYQETKTTTKPMELEAPPWKLFLENFSIDILDFYPMRKWRELCAEHPVFCWLLTGVIWALGQMLAIKAEFGFVYLAFFLILLILLNLGVRQEGEMSAYSVFNPNCERLLGGLNSDDFEREILMRR